MPNPIELIETKPHLVMVVAKSLPNRPGIAAELFSQLGSGGYNIEMIAETGISGNLADISFAISEDQAEKAVEHLMKTESFANVDCHTFPGMGVLTVYGKTLSQEPGVAGKIFSVLAREAINIEMISTSFTAISVLIKESYLGPAQNLLRKELGLDA